MVEDPRPLRSLCPEAPPALAAVVARMLARAPAERHQTPAEAATALAPFALAPMEPAGAVSDTETVPWGDKAGARAARRRRWTARWLALGALAPLVLGLALLPWLPARRELQPDAAETVNSVGM